MIRIGYEFRKYRDKVTTNNVLNLSSLIKIIENIIDDAFTKKDLYNYYQIEAASTINNLIVLKKLIENKDIKNTLEIGLANGASALTILKTQRKKNKDFTHTSIDPLQSSIWKNNALSIIKEDGFSGNFVFFEESSELFLPSLLKEGKKYDLIYVDGSHLFTYVLVDMYYSSCLLKKGGIILFDDCRKTEVDQVIKIINKNMKKFLKPFNLREYYPNKSPIKLIANYFGIAQLKAFIKTDEIENSIKGNI